MLNFQEQAASDLDAVFFNTPAMEFVEQRKIKGVKGNNSSNHTYPNLTKHSHFG